MGAPIGNQNAAGPHKRRKMYMIRQSAKPIKYLKGYGVMRNVRSPNYESWLKKQTDRNRSMVRVPSGKLPSWKRYGVGYPKSGVSR